jgi:hypothetical protein
MGASFHADVLWSDRLGLWIYSTKLDGSRYWNAFGLDLPNTQSTISITGEINLPIVGIDRRIGGALARDKKNNIYLVHRGLIGGSKRGVGKSLFESQFRGVWITMDDGDRDASVALVGVINSPFFARQVVHFIQKIHRIKNQPDAPSAQLAIFDDYALREEMIGTKLSESTRDLEAECNTALIIKDLYERLALHRLRVANDAQRDLFVADKNGAIKAVFLVKTDTAPDMLHQGAMRLLMNSLSLPRQPRLILAVPEAPDRPWAEKLKKLNIEYLIYRWNGDRVEFPALDQLLPLSET